MLYSFIVHVNFNVEFIISLEDAQKPELPSIYTN